MHLSPLTPAPERLPAGAPPPWPAPALLKPPPAPKSHRLGLILTGLVIAAGPLIAGVAIWIGTRGGESIGGAVMTLLSAGFLVGMVVYAQRQQSTLPARQGEHEELLEQLTTCWARVLDCAIVGSESASEGGITHYVLDLELQPWCDEFALTAGHAPDTSQHWRVKWRIPAAVAASVVPGTWFAVAYDTRAPERGETQFMQFLVSMPGAALPLE
ncbi:hypothetical protein LZ198_03065 [Myxococcus sp. K15C18031901]|uniref:hypothetical protein n=1 Tax=Myxococcus dinghuensis TaxID=2906761 RepID=UPI0020A75163|nr:hypothetical protein [Myxococcus dinghuensis]MCP3097851.1 hypothetical protein [Myxococcus dinghuensis]